MANDDWLWRAGCSVYLRKYVDSAGTGEYVTNMQIINGWTTWRDRYGDWHAEKNGQTLSALSHGRLMYLIGEMEQRHGEGN